MTSSAESAVAGSGQGSATDQPTLAKDEVGLLGSTVFALAGAAPGQTVSIVLASLVVSSAYGTVLPLAISAIGLLCIAVAFQRLNMWRQNAGATYEWVCRAFSPYVGNLVGWLMLVAFGGFVLIDVITIGPSVLALLGFSPNNQFVGALAILIIGTALTATAVVGIRPSARLQVTVALIEYVILTVFIVWAFIEVFLVHKAGTVRPQTSWLSFKGTGAGVFSASMVIAVASIAGWDGGIYVNEETERPERNPGLGAVVAVAILGRDLRVDVRHFPGHRAPGSSQRPCRQRRSVRWSAARRYRRRPRHLLRCRPLGAGNHAGRDHRNRAAHVFDVSGPGAASPPGPRPPAFPNTGVQHHRLWAA